MNLLSLCLIAAIVVPTTACAWDKPIPTTPTPDYPCGVTWHSCGNGACCRNNDTCGGAFPSVGCPAGQCCYVGPGDGPDMGAKLDHPMYPQKPESSTH